jgi:pyruvate-formate lyase-activating enzyme
MPGRVVGNPRGSYAPSRERARFSSEFISALLRDFRQGGPAAIAKVRKYQPAAYLKICALLVPKEMKLEYSAAAIKELTDEQLERGIELIKDMLAKQEAGANAKVIEGTAQGATSAPTEL